MSSATTAGSATWSRLSSGRAARAEAASRSESGCPVRADSGGRRRARGRRSRAASGERRGREGCPGRWRTAGLPARPSRRGSADPARPGRCGRWPVAQGPAIAGASRRADVGARACRRPAASADPGPPGDRRPPPSSVGSADHTRQRGEEAARSARSRRRRAGRRPHPGSGAGGERAQQGRLARPREHHRDERAVVVDQFRSSESSRSRPTSEPARSSSMSFRVRGMHARGRRAQSHGLPGAMLDGLPGRPDRAPQM